MQLGKLIKMSGEVQRYKVMGFDGTFAVVSKPFNAKGTCLYSVVNLTNHTRGHFGRWGPPHDPATREGAMAIIADIRSGEHEITNRNSIKLTGDEIEQFLPSPEDASAMAEYENDMRDMSVDQLKSELREVTNKIDEEVPWQEALSAKLRSLGQ